MYINKRTRVLAARMFWRAVLELPKWYIPWVLGSTETFQSDLTVTNKLEWQVDW